MYRGGTVIISAGNHEKKNILALGKACRSTAVSDGAGPGSKVSFGVSGSAEEETLGKFYSTPGFFLRVPPPSLFNRPGQSRVYVTNF